MINFWKQFFLPIRLYGGGGSSGSDAQGRAEEQLAGISEEQWNYYKSSWLPQATAAAGQSDAAAQNAENFYNGEYIPQAEQISRGITQQAGQTQANDNASAAQANSEAAAEYGQAGVLNSAVNQYGIGTLAGMADQANAAGGQADQDYQAMLARGDVDNQFNSAGQNLIAKEQQAGVGANSGQMLAVMNQNETMRAAAGAAAQTQARQAALQLGWTKKQQVVSDATGLASAAQGASAVGTQAASQGVSASGAALGATSAPFTGLNGVASGYNSATSAAGTKLSNLNSLSTGLNGGAQSATSGASAAGGIAGQQAATQAQQDQATSQAIGTGVGAAVAIGGTAAVII